MPTGDRVISSVQALRKMSAAQCGNTLHGRVTSDTERSLLAAASK
jgi:hypothetical protein